MKKKKDEIANKVDQLEKAEKSNAKNNKVKYGPGRRGVAVGVTVGICAALAVGGYFLVDSLIDSSAENQTSNAPAQNYDSGSFAPGNSTGNSAGNKDSIQNSDNSGADKDGSPADSADGALPNGGEFPNGNDISGGDPQSTADGVPGSHNDSGTEGNVPGDPANPSVPGGVPQTTTTRDSGAMTDSGAGVDPVEMGAGGDIYVPSGSDDITVGGSDDDHEITLPSTNGTSGYEITEPSYPGNNDPVYTTAGTTVTTARTSVTTTKTTAATTTTKSTTTRAGSGDNWATLPEEIEEVIISETFEGSLSDFFH